MPRGLWEYDAREWLKFKPSFDALRTWRIRRSTDEFTSKPPRAGDLAALQKAISGRRATTTIAFNDAEILERQIRAMRAFVPDPVHLVADNSDDDRRAAAVAALCAAEGVPYLRLPPNPWGRRSPSRSHGAALNWVWRRLIQPAGPAAFGFLDHDLIPLAPDDPFAALQHQPVAGDKRWVGRRWFLWAGYCFFRTEVFDGVEADFGQDWSIGLDTGGGNWRSLYSKLDPADICERPIEEAPVFPDRPLHDCYYERRGVWVHEVGYFGRPEFAAVKRALVLDLVEAALAEATPARSYAASARSFGAPFVTTISDFSGSGVPQSMPLARAAEDGTSRP